MIEFIRGAWTAERTTLAPAAWKTALNAVVKLVGFRNLVVISDLQL
jgi:hypothetical protein